MTPKDEPAKRFPQSNLLKRGHELMAMPSLSPNAWRLILFAFLGLLLTGFFILEFW